MYILLRETKSILKYLTSLKVESIVKFVSERQSLCDVRGELQVTLTIVKTAEHVSSEEAQ